MNDPEPNPKQVDPRMHSAEHILTAAVMRSFGSGRPVTTHLERKKSKADYRFSRNLTAGEVLELERCVNEIVAADLPVTARFHTREEAAILHDLGRLPDGMIETVRIVHIGDFDACPCIGPHVQTTREIGRFRIVSTSWAEGVLRIRFKLDP